MSVKLSMAASSLAGGPAMAFIGRDDASGERDYARTGLAESKAELTGEPVSAAAPAVVNLAEQAGGLIVETLVPRDIVTKPSLDVFGAVETPFVDTIPANPSTTATLAIGGSVDSMLDTVGDRDWFRVELVAGQRYTFSIGPTGAGDIEDSYLRLYNSAGTLIALNDDAGGLYSRLSFTATTSGTYYVGVGAYDDAEAGNYRVSAALAPPLAVFSNDQIANQLAEAFWGGTERHFNVAPGGTITVNITALTAAGQTLAREALALWTDATGIAFSEIAGTAQMRFIDEAADDPANGDADSAFATSSRIGNIIQSSLVNVGTGWLATYGTGLNSYSFQTYIHEIGHALGLGHAGAYNGTGDYSTDAEYLNDSWATTIMSYFDQTENSYFSAQGFTRQFVVTPVVADILATTYLYGAPSTTRTGDTVYGFNNNSGRAVYDAAQFPSVTYTVVDHGGVDTLDYSLFTQTQRIDLNAEAFSDVGGRVGNVTIARGSVIENAVGGSGNDTIIGNDVANVLYAHRGGDDTLIGGGGDDGFYFGAAMTGADSVDGGTGRDQIGLQGNYANLILGAAATVGVELLVLLPGNDNRFGGATGTNLSYNITTVDANIAAGQLFTFQANSLRAGENFTLNASAETNGSILTFGGLGADNITGGQRDDGFYFGTGRFGASDIVNGGGGSDQLGFQGDFAGANRIVFGANQLVDIEFIVLMSANDARFGGATAGQFFSYDLTMNDNNLLFGLSMVISATTLRAGETLTFDGNAEMIGNFRIFSGAGDDNLIGSRAGDEIWGGAGNDRIVGHTGGDSLRGGAGNDTFYYANQSHSTVSARDQIHDFALGDLIHLADVASFNGFGSFTFVGSGAQTGAQQVQVTQTGNQASVFVYIDADATPEMRIDVTVVDGHTLTVADFVGLTPPPQEPIEKLADFAWLPEDNPFEHFGILRHDAYGDLHGLGRDMVIL